MTLFTCRRWQWWHSAVVHSRNHLIILNPLPHCSSPHSTITTPKQQCTLHPLSCWDTESWFVTEHNSAALCIQPVSVTVWWLVRRLSAIVNAALTWKCLDSSVLFRPTLELMLGDEVSNLIAIRYWWFRMFLPQNWHFFVVENHKNKNKICIQHHVKNMRNCFLRFNFKKNFNV